MACSLRQRAFQRPILDRTCALSFPRSGRTVLRSFSAPSPRWCCRWPRHLTMATAGELAADLSRFLENKPILARRATMPERARKWIRRHPSVLAAGIVLLVLLAAGSFIAAWVIRGEKEKTRLAYEQEKEQFRIA